ncbi:proteasome inhibitor PI31 subunit [Toxorhynchites rutilus septentrionalis]|uniref:proteasome inhibitor PI31 subunit n=1 Tax=Toxorhynchites rutilus septentrionalis TaxID=329112 RepID=UPI002479AAAF|nr:proteasome inhibitor PI31 subunit [Toxorhynchites rutilus septentrionalis]
MSESDYFGFELIFKTVEGSINAKSDVLMTVIHWYLIKNSFRNVGIGDDKTLSESEEKSELLPDGWNANPLSYALRYVNNDQLYILHGTDSRGTMIVNLLKVKTLDVSNITLNIEDTVKQLKGSITSLIPEASTVLSRIRDCLLKPVIDGNQKDGEAQTETETQRPVRSDDPVNPLQIGRPRLPDPLGVGNVGRGDLDPLGRGGGMIFEPPGGFNPLADLRRPGPRGPIPGARFDPFSPPVGSNPRFYRVPDPDPDHMPPPGYDDMFM